MKFGLFGTAGHLTEILRILNKQILHKNRSNLVKDWPFPTTNEWPNPIILKNGDGIFPSRAAKPRVKEIKIPHESRKVHFNFCASLNFSP